MLWVEGTLALMALAQPETPVRFVPDSANTGTTDTSWVNWVVVSSMPKVTTDEERATFLQEFNPDVIDWYGGLGFNRGEFARSRGVACSASDEYEYEESIGFKLNDTLAAFANDGMSRSETNSAAAYGPLPGVFYMELNAPRWKETIKQGDIRPSVFGDVVTQDNIGSPINKAQANFDDYSNARFLRWLGRRCANHPGATADVADGVAAGRVTCSAPVLAALANASFNIRDRIAAVRAGPRPDPKETIVAMELCGSASFGTQDLQTAAQKGPGPIQFEGGLCLATVGATPTNSGTATAAPCSPGISDQTWHFSNGTGMVVSARADCAGNTGQGCCLTISGGGSAPGTIVQLYGCADAGPDPAAFRFHLTYPHPGVGITRLVANGSGLCLTSGVRPGGGGGSSSNEDVIADPVVHEFIRHGYISALANWDDVASAVRRTGQADGARKIPAVWGNQWGLPGTWCISALLSQTSDVVWVEGPPSDSAVSAWDVLTYKVGDASGGFAKPVWTIEYATGRGCQAQLAEGHANGGLLVSMYSKALNHGDATITARHSQFVTGQDHRYLFVDRRRTARVGLIWSVPTQLWRRFSSLIVGGTFDPSGLQFFVYLSGLARILEDRHIPYEILILGHPDVFEDSAQLSRFHEFETLIVPGVDALSDTHVANLTAFVKPGGRLVVAGAATGTRDEELLDRTAGPALASLERSPGDGAVIRITDAEMALYLSGGGQRHSAAVAIAEAIMPPVGHPGLITTLPPTVRSNVFRHGAGPMHSVTFNNRGDTAVGSTLNVSAIYAPCLDQRTLPGCTVTFHNLPLAADGEAPVPLRFNVAPDNSSLLVQLPPIGSLAVLEIGMAREAEARRAAAGLRRAAERAKIAARAIGAGNVPSNDAETLLSMVQCVGAEDIGCDSFINFVPGLIDVYLQDVSAMASTLVAQVSNVTGRVADRQSAGNDAVLASAKSAARAFTFGATAGAGNLTGWLAVNSTREFDGAGYGWVLPATNTSQIHAGKSGSYDAGTACAPPFDTLLWGGGITDAVFGVGGLAPGDHVVTVVVGLWDGDLKVAATGVRDGRLSPLNAGMAGARVRSGIFETRSMYYSVGADGKMLLRITGQAVGPQLNVNSLGVAIETAHESQQGWVITAVLIHGPGRDRRPQLPVAAWSSLATNTEAETTTISSWSVIGPFSDTNSTGLFRAVGSVDAGGLNRSVAVNRSVEVPGKSGAVRWCDWHGLGPVPIAMVIGDDAAWSAAILATKITCPGPSVAVLTASTAGTGVVSLNGTVVAVDEVYAGLFASEVTAVLALPEGGSWLQIKSLSHFTSAEGWEATAGITFSKGSPVCTVSP